ncbi:hypothetical protein [Pseudobdellovibrio sp. HCB154]|uniref:hypothetical protein n=1 Tax=Pseudobdellovibrio sp. HCB154 TaxID=3386277 RepID=UPI003917263E
MKLVFALVSVTVLSIQSVAGNCNSQNLVGEWTSRTESALTPHSVCGKAVKNEKTVFTFMNKAGKFSGHGVNVTVTAFQNQKSCSPTTKTLKYPFVELYTNGSLGIMSEIGAQVIADCVVSSDRAKLKLGSNLYQRTKN